MKKLEIKLPEIPDRSCGTCTKCCEGWLDGSVLGEWMQPGIPCPFVEMNKGCTIYNDRPYDPCRQYSCLWLKDKNIPNWMKPETSNAILDDAKVDGIPYLRLIEAGTPLRPEVLTWVVKYAVKNDKNLYWQVNNTAHWIGSKPFMEAISRIKGNQVLNER